MTFGANDPIVKDEPKGFGADDPAVDTRVLRPQEDDVFTGKRPVGDFAPIPLQGIFLTDEELEASTSVGMYYQKVYGVPPDTAFDLGSSMGSLQYGQELPPVALWDRVKQSYRNGKAVTKLNDLGFRIQQNTADDPLTWEKNLKDITKLRSGIKPDYWEERRSFLERILTGSGEQVPQQVQTVKEGGIYGAAGAVIGGTAGTVVGGPALGAKGFAALGKAGAAFGAFKRMRELETGGIMLQLMDVQDEFGNRLDPKLAATAANIAGTFNGAVEVVEFATMLSAFGIGTKIFENAAAKVSSKMLAEGTMRAIIAKHALKFGAIMTTEQAQEMVQETSGLFAQELAKMLNNDRKGTDFKPITKEAILDQYKQVMEKTFFATVGLAGVGSSYTFMQEVLAPQTVKPEVTAEKPAEAPTKPVEPAKAPEPTVTPTAEVKAAEPAPATVQEATKQVKEEIKATPEGERTVSDDEMAQIRQREVVRRAEITEAAPAAVEVVPIQDQQVEAQLEIHLGDQRALFEDSQGNKLVVGEIEGSKGLSRTILTPEGDIETLSSGPVDTKRWNQIAIPEVVLERKPEITPERQADILRAAQFHIERGVTSNKALTEELVSDFGEGVRESVPDLIKIVKPPKKKAVKREISKEAVPQKPGKKKSLLTRRIEKTLKTEFKDAPEFDGLVLAEQAARVEKIWTEDPELLKAISKQEEPLPKGLRMGSVLKGLEVLAFEVGDVDALRDLAVNPKTATVASVAAQELKAFDPVAFGEAAKIGESPVKAMRSVQEARVQTFEQKSETTAKQAIKKQSKALKAETRKQASAKSLQQFIKDIRC